MKTRSSSTSRIIGDRKVTCQPTAAAIFVGAIVADAKGKRWEGALMIAAYAGMIAAYWFSGDR